MKVTKWVSVDPLSLDEAKPKTDAIQGRHTQVMLSPYDVPKAVRGKLDEENQRFAIEFSYIGSEDTALEENAGTGELHVHPRVGKHSGRLYGLEIDTEVLGEARDRGDLDELVDSAIQHLGNRHSQRIGNYRATLEALSQPATSSQVYEPLQLVDEVENVDSEAEMLAAAEVELLEDFS